MGKDGVLLNSYDVFNIVSIVSHSIVEKRIPRKEEIKVTQKRYPGFGLGTLSPDFLNKSSNRDSLC